MLTVKSRSQPVCVISIFPDKICCEAVDSLIQRLGTDIKHVSVYGDNAVDLLAAGQELIDALGRHAGKVRAGIAIEGRISFSRCASSYLSPAVEGSRYLIVSPSTVPLDLVFDESGNWGDRSIYSHLYSQQAPSDDLLVRALMSKKLPLGGYLLVCPMAMDRRVARHEQDIVTVALALESRMPVELWLQPSFDRAKQAFVRTDLGWLHIDTHGTRTKIMLGPSRGSQKLAGAEELPDRVFTPLIIIVGCALTSGPDSIGSFLFERGAEAVFGPCALFQSLGVANSEEGEAAWYRVLFHSLLSGNDIGTSLLLARRSVAGDGILKYAYLIVGSSFLHFDVSNVSRRD